MNTYSVQNQLPVNALSVDTANGIQLAVNMMMDASIVTDHVTMLTAGMLNVVCDQYVDILLGIQLAVKQNPVKKIHHVIKDTLNVVGLSNAYDLHVDMEPGT